MRVLATGWYGAGNVGDELLLSMLIDWCREAGASVSALSPFPQHTRATHGIDAVDAFNFPAAARSMMESDLFVLGGGGLFQTHHSFTIPGLYDYRPGDIAGYARPLLMARQMDVPTLLWAQGVGPLDNEQARDIVRDVFSHASHASVRDSVSSGLLREIGVEREIPVAPDPVWALRVDSVPAGAGERRRIGLILREWPAAPGWEESFMSALRATVSPHDHVLVWIPFQAGEAGGVGADVALMEEMKANLSEYEHETVISHTATGVIKALGNCERNICMRLHAQILSLKLGRPTMCVEYDAKMSRVSEMAGLPSTARVVPSSSLQTWQDAIGALLAAEGPIAPTERVTELEEAAMEHKRTLHAAIAACRHRPARKRWNADEFDWVRTWADSAIYDTFVQREGYLVAQVVRRDAWLGLSESRLASMNQDLRRSDQAVAEAEAAVTRQESELAAQAARIEALQREVEASDERVTGLRAEIARRQGAEFDYRTEVESRIAIADALMREVSQLHLERETTQRELMHLEGLVAERTNERDRMKQSLSWRLTTPLRFGRDLLTRPKERNRMVYGLLRAVYRALPAVVKTRLTGARDTFVARAPLDQGSSEPGLDWVSLANAAEKVAIVPCAFEFEELANQRPINLAKYLASRGYTVIFAAWQWTRGETLSKSNREVLPGIWQIDLYSLIDQAANLDCRKDSRSVYFITLPSPELVGLHPLMRKSGISVVYDILDEWEAFSGVGQAPWYSAAHEEEAVMASDIVAAVSPPLVEKFGHLRSDMLVIGNGYTAATLGMGNRFCAMDARKGGPAKIGYFGHLTDAWFDWSVVLAAARQLPEYEFEIIGYGEPQWVRDAAETLPNLTLLGKVPPSELWKHARHWHVGLAPFKPGPLAVAIDPIKVYEYIYLGIPTVCTGIPHLSTLPGVAVVEGVEAFVQACREAVVTPPDYDAMSRCLQGTTWEARFDELLHAVNTDGLRGMYVA